MTSRTRERRDAPALALALALALASGCLRGGTTGEPLEFSLTTIDGDARTRADFAGRVLVLDMMATWCAPCRAAMPELREFHAAHPDVGLVSLDVDPSDRTENDDPLPRFRDEFNATWEFAYDTDEVFRRSGARLIPSLVIVGADGVVREVTTDYPLKATDLAERVAKAGGE